MNYRKIYNNIVENRKENVPTGYTETHHITPRCLGGTDDKGNLVQLTAKEHFICHLLLTKMYEYGSIEYYKMCHAFLMMLKCSNNQQRYITSRSYEKLKISFSERMSKLQTGKNNSQYGTKWVYNKHLKICKKVPKDSILEENWCNGKVTNWNNHYSLRKCKNCDTIGCLSRNVKFCSLECKNRSTKTIIEKYKATPIKRDKNIIMVWIHNNSLKLYKKVPQDSILEDGWSYGRKFEKTETCIFCKNIFIQVKKEKCCSNECKFKLMSSSKKVIDNFGNVFNSQTECAIFHKVSEGTVRLRIKKGIYKN